eukprot:scaffold908_cov228-Pinguiococcus_pyrenoidosus.AAC.7
MVRQARSLAPASHARPQKKKKGGFRSWAESVCETTEEEMRPHAPRVAGLRRVASGESADAATSHRGVIKVNICIPAFIAPNKRIKSRCKASPIGLCESVAFQPSHRYDPAGNLFGSHALSSFEWPSAPLADEKRWSAHRTASLRARPTSSAVVQVALACAAVVGRTFLRQRLDRIGAVSAGEAARFGPVNLQSRYALPLARCSAPRVHHGAARRGDPSGMEAAQVGR